MSTFLKVLKWNVIQKEKLKEELITFAQLWPQLSKEKIEDVYDNAELSEDEQESDSSETIEIEDEIPPEKSDCNSRCSDTVKCNKYHVNVHFLN